MIHIRLKWLARGVQVAVLSATLAACGGVTPSLAATVAPQALAAAVSGGYQDVTNVDASGNTAIEQAALSDAEVEALLYMREEEKLAHDVYLALYEQWGLPIFQNISRSEQTHTDAVKTLVERYGLPDPAAGRDTGIFINPELQELYNRMVAQGSQSLADALRVGAAIEEIDILDLEERIAQTDKSDIQLVYENLMKGSRNHLRAFVSNLERQVGETYQPQYLGQATYEAIVKTPLERGGRN